LATTTPGVALEAWNQALADALLPVDVNIGAPVRLACDDDGVEYAARQLGIARGEGLRDLVVGLKQQGLVSQRRGVAALAVGDSADDRPPPYLTGLALLVLAASRMASGEHQSMAAYYDRLAEVLGINVRDSWPQVAGVPELVARFADLAAWMNRPIAGRRGELDLPADVHPEIVGVPINQTLLRAGDRAALGGFFHRAGKLIDAGWDPAHQLARWGGRHRLSVPLAQILDRPELRAALSAALRAAYQAWDGSIIDELGRRNLPAQITLHPSPGRVVLGICVPALETSIDATDAFGRTVSLHPSRVEEAPLDWLTDARDKTTRLTCEDGTLVGVFRGPTIAFEVAGVNIRAIDRIPAGSDALWALTCDETVIARCPPESRFGAVLPPGWVLLCNVDASLLGSFAQDDPDRELGGVVLSGGLRFSSGTWMIDHPPSVRADLPEPAPVSIDGLSHGDLEPYDSLSLGSIAALAGTHDITIGDEAIVIEIASCGPREGIASLAISAAVPQLHSGVQPITELPGARICGATSEGLSQPFVPPLLVRYRATVEVIDADGTTRTLAPPSPAAWLAHVGLGAPSAWEIPNPEQVVWLCVNADRGKLVVAHAAIDVPLTEAVLDTVEWYHDYRRLIDRTDGRADQRWARLVNALEGVQ
jgi:hypothetical protein